MGWMSKLKWVLYIIIALVIIAFLLAYTIYTIGVVIILGILYIVWYYDGKDKLKKHKTGEF